jgi:alkanesulfonate monooxygenase SsuD/methylene tetrahydromethanopterin reductase-like flavin-dependent oxidoreductase (luciferase family)
MVEERQDEAAVHPPRGRLVRLGVVVPADAAEARRLAGLADVVGFDVIWVPDAAMAAAVADLVTAAIVLVRPGQDERWARTVLVSVGRTTAEARARADLDTAFAGVEPIGLFGTLDDCQRQLSQWVADGVRDLRAVVPSVPDVADVLAQLTAVVVGDPATHRPDAPVTPAPPPPSWAAPRPLHGR